MESEKRSQNINNFDDFKLSVSQKSSLAQESTDTETNSHEINQNYFRLLVNFRNKILKLPKCYQYQMVSGVRCYLFEHLVSEDALPLLLDPVPSTIEEILSKYFSQNFGITKNFKVRNTYKKSIHRNHQLSILIF